MKILFTILLCCFSLVTVGQVTPAEQSVHLGVTVVTGISHSATALADVEGISDISEESVIESCVESIIVDAQSDHPDEQRQLHAEPGLQHTDSPTPLYIVIRSILI